MNFQYNPLKVYFNGAAVKSANHLSCEQRSRVVSISLKPLRLVNWNDIEKEITEKVGEIENFNMLGFDQVEFLVKGVKFSFFVSDNYSPLTSPIEYLGNIRLADIESIMAMKMEVMLRRMKFRDYYDIYCILHEGYSIYTDIEKALSLSRHRLSTKNIFAILLGGQFITYNNFTTLEPKYNITKEEIREYILHKLKYK